MVNNRKLSTLNPRTNQSARQNRSGRRNRQLSRQTQKLASALPTLVRDIPVYEILKSEGVELIHDASMRILEEVGIEFRDAEALQLWKSAGADVNGELVRIDRELLMNLISTIPSEFDLHARNPDRTVRVGGRNTILIPNSGSPFFEGFNGERRYATREDNITCVKMSHLLPAIHVGGTIHCEPTDMPVPKRHLALVGDGLLFSDKAMVGDCVSAVRAKDTIKMMKIVMGDAFVDNNAVVTGFLNGNSPLVWDGTMLGAAKVYARHGQPVFMSPFALAGANTSASTAGAIAQLNAEALAGCAFMQLVNRGAPVVYGMFLATVDMRTGAPVTGTPDICHLIYMAGQLSRYYGIPLRTVGMHTGSKILDAQAGYESVMVMHAAILAGVNIITQVAGWIEHGLCCNLSKYVTDGEYCEMFHRYAKGVSFDDFDDAMSAVREVGPAGHFLGTKHTIEHYKDAFFMPNIMDHKNIEQWLEEGSKDTIQRARERGKIMLESYQRPTMDKSVEEELLVFITKRMNELPDSEY